jgi:general secretion pathway protein D
LDSERTASTPAVEEKLPAEMQASPTETKDTDTPINSQEKSLLALQSPEEITENKNLIATEPSPSKTKIERATEKTNQETKQRTISATNERQKIALDFDDADIYEVINALADILQINYIIDPAVRGKVNIHTSGEIDKSQLLPILETIFEINNVAAVKVGDLYKIVPVKEAKTKITDLSIGRDLEEIPSPDRVIIQIVPLRYLPSSEVMKVLKPFVSRGGDMLEYSKGNILVIVERASNIDKLLTLIDIIDIDTFEHMNIRFFKVNNAEVNDITKELENIFTSFGIAKSTEKGLGASFIPIERINYILAITSIPGLFEKVEQWLNFLDAVDMEAEEQVFIYFLENGKASEISDVLTKIYGEGVKERKVTPAATRTTPTRRTTTQRTTPQQTEGISSLQGEIKIVTDETTNSIIVRATPHDYNIIKETIQKLDIIPKQVLIEVLIAEVTLGGDTEFGIEWALLGDSATLGGYKGQDKTEISYGIGGLGTDLTTNLGRGFTYRFDASRLQAFLVAQASQNKLNILSTPHILAADNKEARIEVGDEVPIVTSEYVPLQAERVESTSRSIEYRSTGIILTVTPRINEKGLVAMDVNQEVSTAQETITSGIESPTISNRKAQTSLVVQDGTTVVIGGLIKEQMEKSIKGVPFLSSIPLLGYLFSDTSEKKGKSELIIMITPHVVRNFDEAEMITQEFKEKLGEINRLISKSEEKWAEQYR